MSTIQFFLQHHYRLYFKPSGIFNQIQGLSNEKLRVCQQNLNSIAWLIWHLARCEDVAINRIIFDYSQVLDTDNYILELQIPRRDIGTSMTYGEVIGLSNQIHIDSLRSYCKAVATKTQKVIPNLTPEELNSIPDTVYLSNVLFEEGVLSDNSKWVADHYANRSKSWFLGHLALTHGKGHLGQIILLKKLLSSSVEVT